MTPELFHRAREVFYQAVALQAGERSELLRRETCGDAELRAEVESLLASHDRDDDSSLEPPAINWRIPLAAPKWTDSLLGKRIGHYRLLRLIATGGMGCVFEARQDHPDRAVAVKLLRPGFSATSALDRFRVEPEILGRLRHANIAQVYEAGVHDDAQGPLPYFAMELIAEARTLSEFANSPTLTLNARLALFAKICDAVHYGHQNGIIHRDLKPGNILVDTDGEPKIIDFGVARATDSDVVMTTQCTRVGDLVGTLRYMSPEQCDGNAAKIDTRSDIYSLGVVLYELLTGVAPYETTGTTVYAAIRVIKDEPPRRPSEVNHALRGDLDAILLKALEKEPARRYASAAGLADDLRRVLAHEPITARPPSLGYVLSRYARRHVWQSVSTVLAIVGVSVLLLILELNRQHTSEKKEAAAEKAKAEAKKTLAEAQKEQAEAKTKAERTARMHADYRGILQRAEGALSANDGQGAAFQLGLVADDALRGWESKHLLLRADQSLTVHQVRQDRARTNEASIDGHDRLLVQEAYPGPRIDIFDLDADAIVRTIQREEIISLMKRAFPAAREKDLYGTHAVLSQPGDCLALAIPSKHGVIFSMQDPRSGREFHHWYLTDAAIPYVRFHPVLPRLTAVITVDRSPRFYSWSYSVTDNPQADGSAVPPACETVNLAGDWAGRFSFSPDGKYFAGTEGYGARLWKSDYLLRGGETPGGGVRLLGHTYHCTNVRFSGDSRQLVTCSTDRTVRVWDVDRCFEEAAASKKIVDPARVNSQLLTGPTAGLQCVTFDRSSDVICAGDDDGVVWAWKRERAHGNDVAPQTYRWQLCNTLRGHCGEIRSIDALANGKFLTASTDGMLRIWNPMFEDLPRFRGHRTSVTTVAITSDGKHAVSGDGSYSMVIWDIDTGAAIARAANPLRSCLRKIACWSADERVFVVAAYTGNDGGHGGRLVLWGLDSEGRPFHLFEYFGPNKNTNDISHFHSVGVSHDGRRIAAGDGNGDLHLLQLSEDRQTILSETRCRVHHDAVLSVSLLDAKGSWLVTTSGSGSSDLTVHSADCSIRLVNADLPGRESILVPAPHRESVTGIDVRFGDSSRGENSQRAVEMATSDAAGSICLWSVLWVDNVPQPTLRETLRGHRGPVYKVAFLPHTSPPRLASVGDDRTVRIWDTEGRSELVALRGAKGTLSDLAFDPVGQRLFTTSRGMTGADNVVLVWDGVLPDLETRAQRGDFMKWYSNIRDAIQPAGDHLARPDLLLDEYPQHLAGIAASEGWPAHILKYAEDHSTAFVHNITAFAESAWVITCDSTCDNPAYERALRHAERATELDPWNALAWSTIGAARYRLRQLTQAVAALERAQALFEERELLGAGPQPRLDLLVRSMVSARLGRNDQANEVLIAFLATIPENVKQSDPKLAVLLDEVQRTIAETR